MTKRWQIILATPLVLIFILLLPLIWLLGGIGRVFDVVREWWWNQ